MKRVQFIEKTAGRDKGTIEVVNDGLAKIWKQKNCIRFMQPEKKVITVKPKDKEVEKEPKDNDDAKEKDMQPSVNRAFAGAPIRKG